QGAGLAVQTHAVPVEYTICRVGVLLDLENDQTRADGMEAAAREEHRVTGLHLYPVAAILDRTHCKFPLKFLPCHSATQADKQLCPRLSIGNIPHFSFGLASQLRGLLP